MKLMLFAVSVLFALIILFINRNLAAFAEWVYPGSEPWVHLALLAVELLAFFWFWRGLFGGHKHLLLVSAASEEERQCFAEELGRRMRKNPLLKEAGIVPASFGSKQEYLQASMDFLNGLAERETEQMARRVFLATALSQNGRLDALIVFVCLCRLVWRVSAIYNQRPHPREIASLYAAVATSTFLALSLEEFDITTEVTVGFGEAFQAMIPAGVTASIPLAGRALQTFTAATIDGAANCYLTLRTGIIARNAYAYGARQEKKPSRAVVFKEAGAILFAMSGDLVERVAATIADCVAGAARSAGGKTVQAGKSLVEGLGASAGRLAVGTVCVVQDTGKGVVRAGTDTVKTVGNVIGRGTGNAVGLVWKPFKRMKEPDK